MSEPIKLVTQPDSLKAAVNADIVARLEGWLERAKAGELAGLAMMATLHDGGTTTNFSLNIDRMQFAGLLATVQYRMLKACDDAD